VRKLAFVLVGASAVATAAAVARADDAGPRPAPAASMVCDRAPSPGRVRCEVEARVGAGESIAWGDVVILRTPAFVGALRGRIGPHDAITREAGVWRWALGLVARGTGTGDILGQVRLVVCKGESCLPREVPVTGSVVVGGGPGTRVPSDTPRS
jgi:hypothetical protein